MNSLTFSPSEHTKSNDKLFLWLIGIALGSIFLLLCVTNFNSEMFLYDDNRAQWMPVMDKAYDQFFSTGIMPNYDFFQFKGLEIADEGFYSLTNPIMMFSYIIYRFVFFKSWGATISFYIMIMTVSGNISAFFLCRELGLNNFRSVWTVALYSSCTAFFKFGYWYYVYNNYLIVPLLLYLIIKLKNSKLSYTACGIVLAFSLLMGNVQYTVYHYVMYCIIVFCMGVFGNKKNFLKMLANCMTGLLLSVPQLLLLVQAASRSSVYSTQAVQDLSYNIISLPGILVGIFIPLTFFPHPVKKMLYEIFTGNALSWRELFFLYAGGLGYCIYGLFFMLVSRFRQNYVKSKKTIHLSNIFHLTDIKSFYVGTAVSLLFFVLMFTGGLSAYLFSVLPVVKNFRYMVKAYLVFLPLCIVPAAVFMKNFRKKWVYIILSISILVGVCHTSLVIKEVQIFFPVPPTVDNITRYPQQAVLFEQEADKNHIDTKNYSICSFVDMEDKRSAVFETLNRIQKNAFTTVGAFSPVGYENTASEKSFQQSDHIFTNLSEAHWGNAGGTFIFDSTNMDAAEWAVTLEKQLIDNSVKYLVFSSHQDTIDMVHTYFQHNMKTVAVIRTFPFMKDCVMMELDGIPALCTSDSGNDVTLQSRMDTLSFEPDKNVSTYRLSFTYKDNLRADYISNDGSTKQQLATAEDKDGYLLVKTNGLSNGTVKITYTNPWIIVGNITSILTSILFFGLMAVLIFQPAKLKQYLSSSPNEQECVNQ